jgi:hypothetical protein
MYNRSVLAIEGGTAGALDFRFKMNSVLRATRKAASKIAYLRGAEKAKASWENTNLVQLQELELLLESYSQRQEALRGEVKEVCEKYRKPIPLEFLPPGVGRALADVVLPSAEFVKPKFQAIQDEQAWEEAMNKFAQTNHSYEIGRRLTEETIVEGQRARGKRLADGAALAASEGVSTGDFYKSPESEHIRKTCHLPKIVSEQPGLTLEYYSSKEILKGDYQRLAAFLDRHGEDSRWFAPQEAFDSTGALLPLTQRYETLCLKNLSLTDKTMKSINRELKEAIAWRWLVISHNHEVGRENQIKLPARLTLSYERKVKRQGTPPARPSDQTESVRKIVEDYLSREGRPEAPAPEPSVKLADVQEFLDSVYGHLKWAMASYADPDDTKGAFELKHGKTAFKAQVDRANLLMEQGQELFVGNTIKALDPPGPDVELDALLQKLGEVPQEQTPEEALTFDDAEWEAAHPESFDDEEGRTFFRFDIDLIDVAEGQYMLSRKRGEVEYYAVAGEAVGPSKSKKAKGKTAVIPLPPKVKEAPKPKEGKSEPLLTRENPLRVKGEPKSKALSDDQRKTLRAFFKLKDGLVPHAEWVELSTAEKAAALKERSIPKWATEAVLRSPANLQLILEGKLKKENANSAAGTPKVAKTVVSSQALSAWQQLKSDFKGTALLKSPQSAKEKAFRRRFDQLLADYGQQPCFPKLRERPDQQGRASSSAKGSSKPRNQSSDLLDMVKAMGEIARAWSGKG